MNLNLCTPKEKALKMLDHLYSMYDCEISYTEYCELYDAISSIPTAAPGENTATEYADCDQFICSECGIHLQDWNLIEDDYEDGIVHEFVFNFCPNCGADMRERSAEE